MLHGICFTIVLAILLVAHFVRGRKLARLTLNYEWLEDYHQARTECLNRAWKEESDGRARVSKELDEEKRCHQHTAEAYSGELHKTANQRYAAQTARDLIAGELAEACEDNAALHKAFEATTKEGKEYANLASDFRKKADLNEQKLKCISDGIVNANKVGQSKGFLGASYAELFNSILGVR